MRLWNPEWRCEDLRFAVTQISFGDLPEAEPEDEAPHGLEALEGELEPDHEEQKGDAELGGAGQRLGAGFGGLDGAEQAATNASLDGDADWLSL